MQIRIIPMSIYNSEFEGKTINQIQKEFFDDYLIYEGKGWYYYGRKGMEANKGDLLLFQMKNSIIASAKLNDIIRFKKPTIDGNLGVYILSKNTIKSFKPITKKELSELIIGFKTFSQIKQKFYISDVSLKLLNARMSL